MKRVIAGALRHEDALNRIFWYGTRDPQKNDQKKMVEIYQKIDRVFVCFAKFFCEVKKKIRRN